MTEYKDKDGRKYSHIYLVKEPSGSIKNIGWYFGDEADQLHGPFRSLGEVQWILSTYCRNNLRMEEGI